MAREINKEYLERLLEDLKGSVTRQECWSCECLQGLLVQLEIDFKDVLPCAGLEELKVGLEETHKCLGCEPCGPGEVYTEYLLEETD